MVFLHISLQLYLTEQKLMDVWTLPYLYPVAHAMFTISVDQSYPEEERQLRRAQREKFRARPRTAAIDQYREPYVSIRPIKTDFWVILFHRMHLAKGLFLEHCGTF